VNDGGDCTTSLVATICLIHDRRRKTSNVPYVRRCSYDSLLEVIYGEMLFIALTSSKWSKSWFNVLAESSY